MKWKNALTDKVPPHDSVVLISVGGIYYIAYYDDNVRIFRIRDELRETHFRIGDHQIYWTEYENN